MRYIGAANGGMPACGSDYSAVRQLATAARCRLRPGLQAVRRLQRRGRSAWLSFDLLGRTPFTGFGQVSASLSLLTWVAAKTKTLRLGTAVLVLPWHNPVLVAEQAGTIDLLSGGRLDFGVGKGYRHNEFAGFCLPIEEADARFNESLDVIVNPGPRSSASRMRVNIGSSGDIIVEPPTAQKPHPPIWMGAGSPDSIRAVAARGYNLLLDQFASFEAVAERIAIFKPRSKSAAGHSIRWKSVSRALSMSPRTPPTRMPRWSDA